jgi:putative ABC transport system permease protein
MSLLRRPSADSSTATPRADAGLVASRLHPSDLLRVGSIGLRTRRLRAALSALGIAIGIAAMVAVLGISESSRADVLSVLDRLGTNLLTVEASAGIGGGGTVELPATTEVMLRRIEPVEAVASATDVDAGVYRTDQVPEGETNGITPKAIDVELLDTLTGDLAHGRFLDAANDDYPVVVLGSVAADRLGIDDLAQPVQIYIGGEWFSVIGILERLDLAADIDRSVLIGRPIATDLFDTPSAPGVVYVRTDPDQVEQVSSVIPQTTNPENPDQVTVTRPSDAIEARAATNSAFTSLFLGLGLVALLVGGVGIANVMVVSVLERRSEIGLRRAIGATRRHITVQFLSEALLLALLGGCAGAILGGLVTAGYDIARGWEVVVPPIALGGGVAAAMLIGAVAGLYPAMRAARLSPTEALRTV